MSSDLERFNADGRGSLETGGSMEKVDPADEAWDGEETPGAIPLDSPVKMTMDVYLRLPRGDGQLWSCGSVSHTDDERTCKPCAFFHNDKKQCRNGVLCQFCHAGHIRKQRIRLSKYKREEEKRLICRLRKALQMNASFEEIVMTFTNDSLINQHSISRIHASEPELRLLEAAVAARKQMIQDKQPSSHAAHSMVPPWIVQGFHMQDSCARSSSTLSGLPNSIGSPMSAVGSPESFCGLPYGVSLAVFSPFVPMGGVRDCMPTPGGCLSPQSPSHPGSVGRFSTAQSIEDRRLTKSFGGTSSFQSLPSPVCSAERVEGESE